MPATITPPAASTGARLRGVERATARPRRCSASPSTSSSWPVESTAAIASRVRASSEPQCPVGQRHARERSARRWRRRCPRRARRPRRSRSCRRSRSGRRSDAPAATMQPRSVQCAPIEAPFITTAFSIVVPSPTTTPCSSTARPPIRAPAPIRQPALDQRGRDDPPAAARRPSSTQTNVVAHPRADLGAHVALEDVERRLAGSARASRCPSSSPSSTLPYSPSPTRRGKTSRSIEAALTAHQQRRAPSARARTRPRRCCWCRSGPAPASRRTRAPTSRRCSRTSPYDDGSSTGYSASVARAPDASCAAICADRSRSVSVSPLSIRKRSSSMSSANFNAPPVPKRSRLLQVAQPHADRRAVAEHVAHAVGQVPAGHHDVVDAVRRAASRA